MMHKFSKTGEYAKKRLKIALAEDRAQYLLLTI